MKGSNFNVESKNWFLPTKKTLLYNEDRLHVPLPNTQWKKNKGK
jgi:hypothetical protein